MIVASQPNGAAQADPHPFPSPQGGGRFRRAFRYCNDVSIGVRHGATLFPSPLWGGVRGGGEERQAGGTTQ
jgi:hypothetical protein